MTLRVSAMLLCSLVIVFPSSIRAAWQPHGVALCAEVGDQWTNAYSSTISDGAGGAIVTWQDQRLGASNPDIYAQRIDASGNPMWSPNGVAICAAASYQQDPRIVSDGAGGAIVTWDDYRNGPPGNVDIYAQRVNAAGVVQWTANGVVISTATGVQVSPAITSDGAGGAIMAWLDSRSGTSFDIYVQRVNASGVAQWTVNGVALCTAAESQDGVSITSDGAGGAIAIWLDARIGSAWHVYAQRVNASGGTQWTVDGVALNTLSNNSAPTILADGAGGAIACWEDSRGGSRDIFAQRVNASGAVQWPANGIAICIAFYEQWKPRMVADGAGGAIVTWQDDRADGYSEIYAQRISASGAAQWTLDGVGICTAALDQRNPAIVSDGTGGAIMAWQDSRGGTFDIYAQRVDASGTALWTPNGTVLSSAANNQNSPAVVSSGEGAAAVVFSDNRSGSADVYAQRVESQYGYWGYPEPVVLSAYDVPNDQGGKVAVNWSASDRDRPTPRTIGHYSVWRVVPGPAVTMASAATTLNDLRDVGPYATGPLYLTVARPRDPNFTFVLEFVGATNAHAWPGYAYVVTTRADSTATDASNEMYFIAAHDKDDDYVAFLSTNSAVGHSVDNLAPLAPLGLIAQRVGRDVQLRWNRSVAPDLRDYTVYRATASGVTPVPGNFFATSEDTVAVDANAPVSVLYYIVTATDVHDNRSAPSNEASVHSLTGIGNLPAITALTVLQNYPNPFAGSTDLAIGLPRASDVSIEIYDVAGRVVRREQRSRVGAGWQRVSLSDRGNDGKPLASGVYFYRVTAAGSTVTRKMVIAR